MENDDPFDLEKYREPERVQIVPAIAPITFIANDIIVGRHKYESVYRRPLEFLGTPAGSGYVTEAAVCRTLNGNYDLMCFNTSAGEDFRYNGLRIDTKFKTFGGDGFSREIQKSALEKEDIDYILYFARLRGPIPTAKNLDSLVGTVIYYEGCVPFRVMKKQGGSCAKMRLMNCLPGTVPPDEEDEIFYRHWLKQK